MTSGIRVARTPEEVEELRPLWERFQGASLSTDLDFFLAHVRHAPAVMRPHVVLVEQGGEPAALVVARADEARIASRLGYRTVLAPRLRAITVVYGGVLGPLVETDPEAVLDAFRRSVAPGEADVLRFRMLELGSPLHAVAAKAAPFHRRRHFERPSPHWRSELGGSRDEFLSRRSRRRRESVRRYVRRLERTYGDRIGVETVRGRDGLEELFAASLAIHRKTYQAALPAGLSAGDIQLRLDELAADRGWFRGYLLSLDERPVAFWHGTAYRGAFGIGATGFDPDLANERPGTYLLMRLIDDLCADESVHTLDFGFGDAEYKRHFGDESVLEEDVLLFAAGPRAVAANLSHAAFAGATAAGRAALERGGRIRDVRRRHRAKLEQRREG